ncbi:Oxygen regulatory protein NreC [Candidatus Hydrogenisulfobacillus filiaventi]|uniref:Stage 0 sporulation protein A homolog n=1 Tax=Candidatus Hydrogenisulfobacillus filiaventi TaxID=2707344 RepID=A0A6F8ZDB0_9FIRM|nr:response regulator transcription factor [Bacillota bacterium]CAB1127674.1 Oxygen regulatory protein NreC [Candidatus Hydrogenisulfobacillus filiaventi]
MEGEATIATGNQSGPESGPVRIFLVDDHPVVRAGLAAGLGTCPDFQLVGQAGTLAEATEAVLRLNPDVVVLDILLPDGDGLQLPGRLQAAGSKARVLVYTQWDEASALMRSLAAGARGVLSKAAALPTVAEAIRVVAAGHLFLTGAAAEQLLSGVRASAPPSQPAGGPTLSPRERAVVRGVALGFTSAQIAEEMGLSPKTVETYRARAMQKLGATSRRAMVQAALALGILSGSEDAEVKPER